MDKESSWNFKRKMELLSLDMGRHAERSQYCNIVVTPNFYFFKGLASMVRWTQLTFHQHHQSNEMFQPHIPYFQLPTVFLIGKDFKLCVMCLCTWRHTQTHPLLGNDHNRGYRKTGIKAEHETSHWHRQWLLVTLWLRSRSSSLKSKAAGHEITTSGHSTWPTRICWKYLFAAATWHIP